MGIEVTIKRKRKAELPVYKLDKETFSEIGEELSDNVIVNIQDGRKGDIGRLKANKPSTQKIKRRHARLWRGKPASLIDRQHRFIKPGQGGSWRYWADATRVRLEPANQMIRKLNRWVQEKGYLGYWGITKTTRRRIKRIMKDKLLAIVKGQRKTKSTK